MAELRRPAIGAACVLVTLAGGAMIMIGLVGRTWTRSSLGTDTAKGEPIFHSITLDEIRRAGFDHPLPVLSLDYVTWLSWSLLVIAVLTGLIAAVPGPNSAHRRLAGVGVGVGGALATYFATTTLFDAGLAFREDHNIGFSDAEFGAHLAFAGFLVCALGAALGPFGAGEPSSRAGFAVPGLGRLAPAMRTSLSIAISVVAAALLVLAFTDLTWFHQTHDEDMAPDMTFAEIERNYLDPFTAVRPGTHPHLLAHSYFPVLAWALLITSLVLVLLANLRGRFTAVFRAAGIVLGLGGIVVTYLTLRNLFSGPGAFLPNDSANVLGQGRAGVWVSLAAFVLYAVAALLAPPSPDGSEPPSSDRTEPVG